MAPQRAGVLDERGGDPRALAGLPPFTLRRERPVGRAEALETEPRRRARGGALPLEPGEHAQIATQGGHPHRVLRPSQSAAASADALQSRTSAAITSPAYVHVAPTDRLSHSKLCRGPRSADRATAAAPSSLSLV